MSWMTRVLFVRLLWIYAVCKTTYCTKDIFTQGTEHIVVVDNFRGALQNQHLNCSIPVKETAHIVFLQRNATGIRKDRWPQILKNDGSHLLMIFRRHIKRKLCLQVIEGKQCCTTPNNTTGPCMIRFVDTETICSAPSYDEYSCNKFQNFGKRYKNRYIINITTTDSHCVKCKYQVKQPESVVKVNGISRLKEGEKIDPAEAANVMNKMADLVSSFNTSSAALTVAEGVSGILVKEPDPEDVDYIVFAYTSPNESMTLIDRETLADYSRSISVSGEAFHKALSLNISVPFAAALRFFNLDSDEKSTVLNNEVLAVEMGVLINNLTDKLYINFLGVKYEGIPSCQSWNGIGSRPNWTDQGCVTITNEDDIICECSHLTFFAVLLAPLNESISKYDLNNLTVITQVGCGISLFFLCVIIFLHFFLRRTQASVTVKFIINLVSAMFLLNLTFLINNFVAKLKNFVCCKILAALMHYSMLATFTWFAVQAFNICLQMYTGGRITIQHYVLKVSVVSWALPSAVVIVLLITGKYGEQVIALSDTEEDILMCWITDSYAHFITNIGYFSLVFLYNLATFITILSWLFCFKTAQTDGAQGSGKRITVILGLCCMLGITWSFGLFAYGAFQIPAYYIFTGLNSLQGLFLFIFYYNTSQFDTVLDHKFLTSSSTLQTNLTCIKNPYPKPLTKEETSEN